MIDYYPLGSIVILQGGTRKVLVIARALNVKHGNETFFFDYAGVPYPEGLTGDQAAYFNHDTIAKVVFKGYHDVDDEVMVENINQYLNDNPNITRGSAEAFKD